MVGFLDLYHVVMSMSLLTLLYNAHHFGMWHVRSESDMNIKSNRPLQAGRPQDSQ
jgi:hypothetical protein